MSLPLLGAGSPGVVVVKIDPKNVVVTYDGATGTATVTWLSPQMPKGNAALLRVLVTRTYDGMNTTVYDDSAAPVDNTVVDATLGTIPKTATYTVEYTFAGSAESNVVPWTPDPTGVSVVFDQGNFWNTISWTLPIRGVADQFQLWRVKRTIAGVTTIIATGTGSEATCNDTNNVGVEGQSAVYTVEYVYAAGDFGPAVTGSTSDTIVMWPGPAADPTDVTAGAESFPGAGDGIVNFTVTAPPGATSVAVDLLGDDESTVVATITLDAPGGTDAFTTLGAGDYFVRATGVNAAGNGQPSGNVPVTVPIL